MIPWQKVFEWNMETLIIRCWKHAEAWNRSIARSRSILDAGTSTGGWTSVELLRSSERDVLRFAAISAFTRPSLDLFHISYMWSTSSGHLSIQTTNDMQGIPFSFTDLFSNSTNQAHSSAWPRSPNSESHEFEFLVLSSSCVSPLLVMTELQQ